jgi:hypothetical protein
VLPLSSNYRIARLKKTTQHKPLIGKSLWKFRAGQAQGMSTLASKYRLVIEGLCLIALAPHRGSGQGTWSEAAVTSLRPA